ncbi:MAG: hypothetical protein HY670_10545 [Chloroflexi bacterium]|nr:hypothetical protein [Chloroflexota bacterium]
MDTDSVLRALRQVPEMRLRLIEMAWGITGEDGSLDLQRVAFYRLEMAEAIGEAQAYVQATREAVHCLREIIHS